MSRGQIDNIHILTHIIEKACEYNIQRNILFISFREVFGSIYRHRMIKILELQENTVNMYD